MATTPSIAVVGAGISGLTCALRLAEQGRQVTLIEGSDQLGGLGTFFEHDGRTFEKFYHCMLPSDGPLLDLLESLGLRDEVYWKKSSFGYADQGTVFPLNQPLDLLRFSPLPFVDRLRVGLTGAWGRVASARGLDDRTTAEWLQGLSGRRAFRTFWQPMLEAKFGDRYQDVPALWFWTRFNREKGESKGERKGYLRGGYKRIIEAFRRRFEELGVDLRLNQGVERVDLNDEGLPMVTSGGKEETFDQVILTLPWPVIGQIAGSRLKEVAGAADWEIDFQGVINHVLFLKRPLTRHYWLATPHAGIPFDGVVETSTLTEDSDRGVGRHVVYLTKYLHRSDPRFQQPDADIRQSWWNALRQMFPDLTAHDIEAQYVFRAPFVEPVYTRGYSKRRPQEVLANGRVFVATTAQVYPIVTSWNGSICQVMRTLEAMHGCAPQPAAN